MGRRNQALGAVGAPAFAIRAVRAAGCATGTLWWHCAPEHPFTSRLSGPLSVHQIFLPFHGRGLWGGAGE